MQTAKNEKYQKNFDENVAIFKNENFFEKLLTFAKTFSIINEYAAQCGLSLQLRSTEAGE